MRLPTQENEQLAVAAFGVLRRLNSSEIESARRTLAKVILKLGEKIAASDPEAAYKELSRAVEFGANVAAVDKLRLRIQVAQKQKLIKLVNEGDLIAAANLLEQISKFDISNAKTLLNELPEENREALTKMLEDRLNKY